MYIKLKQILSFYEYPLLWVAESEDHSLYLCEIIDDEPKLKYWCVPITDMYIDALQNGYVSLKQIFIREKKNLFVSEINNFNEYINVLKSVQDFEIPESWIPCDNSFLTEKKFYLENEISGNKLFSKKPLFKKTRPTHYSSPKIKIYNEIYPTQLYKNFISF